MVDKSSLYRKKSLFRVEICQKDAKILRGWFLANGKHIRLQAPIFARFWAPLRSFLVPISWIEHLNAWLPPNSRFFFFCCLDLEKRLLFLLSEALVLSIFFYCYLFPHAIWPFAHSPRYFELPRAQAQFQIPRFQRALWHFLKEIKWRLIFKTVPGGNPSTADLALWA